MAGKVVETVFDMWIKSANEEKFIFIKYSSQIDPDDKRSSQKAIYEMYAQKIWCAENNKTHCVLTELDIRINPIIISNKKTLIPYYLPVNDIKKDLYDLILKNTINGSITIRELENCIPPTFHPATTRNYIYALIYHGILVCNQNECIISSLTEVHLNVKKTHLG
ncbi:hypothetical protein MHB46_01415 [Paenibacillus sp. FSL H7-0703]|uniref:hypothetical protein n=1 Tax=Paenibacillus sp. FSL H7-0703 TaxID=2921438 RepID=UPI0030FB7B0D